MTYKMRNIYLGIILVSLGALITSTVIFNHLIDPLGISPAYILSPSTVADKAQKYLRDRETKIYDILFLQPKTLFIGSSRIKQTIDPQKFKDTKYAPIYNYGMDDLGSVPQQYEYIKRAIKIDRKLKYIFVELFPMALFYDNKNPVDPDNFSIWKKLIEDYLVMNFSYSSILSSAIEFKNKYIKKTANEISERFNNGFVPLPSTKKSPFSALNAAHFIVYNFPKDNHTVESPTCQLTALYIRKIAELCKKNGVECYFIFTPIRSESLFALHYFGFWEAFDYLKKVASQNAKTYDFSFLNPLTDEALEDNIKYWPELNHFSKECGDIILEELIKSQELKEYKSEICSVLQKEKIDELLNSQKEKFLSWEGYTNFLHRLENTLQNAKQRPLTGNIKGNSITIKEKRKLFKINPLNPTVGFLWSRVANREFKMHAYIKNLDLCLKCESLLITFDNHKFYEILPNMKSTFLPHVDTLCAFSLTIRLTNEDISCLDSLRIFLLLKDNIAAEISPPKIDQH